MCIAKHDDFTTPRSSIVAFHKGDEISLRSCCFKRLESKVAIVVHSFANIFANLSTDDIRDYDLVDFRTNLHDNFFTE